RRQGDPGDLVSGRVRQHQGVVDGEEELRLVGVRVALLVGQIRQSGSVGREGRTSGRQRAGGSGLDVDDLDPPCRGLASEPVVLFQEVQVGSTFGAQRQLLAARRFEQEGVQDLAGAGGGVHSHQVGTLHGDRLRRVPGRWSLGRRRGGGGRGRRRGNGSDGG